MNRFDEIWKNRFNENDLPVEAWNDPDAQVWEGIDASFEKDNRRFGGIWFWMGATVLLIALLSILWFSWSFFQSNQTSQINDYAPTQIALKTDRATTSESIALTQTPIALNSTKKSTDQIKITPKAKNHTSKTSQNPILETSESNHLFENTQTNRTVISQVSNQPFLMDQTPKEVNETAQEAVVGGVKNNLNLDALTPLPLLQNRLSSNVNPNFQLTDIQPVIKPIGSTKRFNIEATAGAIHWLHRISDQYTNDLSAYEFYDTDEFGWQVGLNAGWDINNHFDLSVGIQYENVKVQSGHNGDLIYSPTAETNGQQNTYNLSLATPYGFSPAEFILNRSTDVGGDDVALKVDFQSTHSIANVRVPVDLEIFPFGKSRNFAPFVQLGGGYNYLTKVANQISEIDTHHSAIQFNDSGLVFAKPEINKSFFDVSLGGGVSYQISPTTNFNLTYQYARGLRPVFEMQDYQTAIDRQRLTVGWKKSF